MAEFALVKVPIVPLRAEKADKSEMISQLLYGECVEILSTEKNWIKVSGRFDNYEGWADLKMFEMLTQETYKLLLATPCKILIDPIGMKIKGSQVTYLLAGSIIYPELDLLNYSDFNWIGKYEDIELLEYDISIVALKFLNAPYLWGGKSFFGIDCSGFSQLVFRLCGISLDRDAWQQAKQGTAVDFLDEAKAGDLAFFSNDEGKIIHVGILISNGRIIHAHGYVRIDLMDHNGIYQKEKGNYTHTLRIIKRIL